MSTITANLLSPYTTIHSLTAVSNSVRVKGLVFSDTTFLVITFVVEINLTIPWQKVFTPFHLPLARHVLESEPFNTKPSSQLNMIVLGKVVFDPKDEPFFGVSSSPQSLAVTNKCYTVKLKWGCHFSSPLQCYLF